MVVLGIALYIFAVFCTLSLMAIAKQADENEERIWASMAEKK